MDGLYAQTNALAAMFVVLRDGPGWMMVEAVKVADAGGGSGAGGGEADAGSDGERAGAPTAPQCTLTSAAVGQSGYGGLVIMESGVGWVSIDFDMNTGLDNSTVRRWGSEVSVHLGIPDS